MNSFLGGCGAEYEQGFDIFDVGNDLEPLNPGLTSGVSPERSRRAIDVKRLRREVSGILVVRNMSN